MHSVRQRVRADGRVVETRRSPVPGGGFVMLYVDMTTRVRAEAALADQQRMFGLLIDATQEGFWFIDNEQRTTELNPAMCQILGRPREQVIGRSIYDFVDAENAQIFRDRVAERARGLAGGYEIALRRPDGSLRHCFNNASPVFDANGARIGAVGLFSDISEQKAAEAQIRRTGELLAQKSRTLELTMNSVSQGIITLDAQGRCTAYNARLLELLDLPASLFEPLPTMQQIIHHQHAHGHFGPDMALVEPATRAELMRVMQHGGNPGAATFVRRTHDHRMLEVRSKLLADASMVRTVSDVTAHLQAQDALRESQAHAAKLALVAAHTDTAVAICGADGRAEWVNPGFERLTGYTLAEIARPASERGAARAPDRPRGGRRARPRSARSASAPAPNSSTTRRTGVSYWVSLEVEPVCDDSGLVSRIISSARDISLRKTSEAALVAARDEAERANRAKSQFLSRMSHELRTPMNAILGFGQLLEADTAPALHPRQRGHVRELLRGGTHLLNLINEVLDLARIEAGQFQLSFESVDVPALCMECAGLMQPLAEERQVELQFDDAGPPLHARADRLRLKQVLLNLLSNAIKYNRQGGRVRLHCRAEGDEVCVHVHDTGPGLDDGQLQRLFKVFERLDAHKSTIEGAGIGLALSKQLIEVMHGRLGVHSEPGAGSTFYVRLAAAPPGTADAPLPSPEAAPQPAGAPGSKTVLYIEDDPVNVMLMEAMLAQLPQVQLLSAALPEQGLALAATMAPDLILLDIQLPGIDGFEVLRRLRARPETRAIPVIAVSANAMHGDVDEGLNAGFNQYLTKPLELTRLLEAVSRQLLEPARA